MEQLSAALSRKSGKTLSRKTKRNLFVLAVMIPFGIWMLIYMLIPLFSVIMYSFTNAKMQYDTFSFVGLYQYEKIFSGTRSVTSMWNTVKAALIIMPVSLVLSVLSAAGLNALSNRSRKLCTFAYFLPNIMSMTAICLVWQWLYHNQYGVINAVLSWLGFEKQQFVRSSSQALVCLCIIHIWSIFGYYAVIILASMRGIDKSLYESADIGGANAIQKFFYITLPMLKNTLLFVCIMLTTSAFMFFTPVKLICDRGTPGTSTLVMLLHIYEEGIEQGNIGYSSAMSVLLMLIILFFSLLQWFLTKERTKPLPKIKDKKGRA